MEVKYYCYKSIADEGGTNSGLEGYVYLPPDATARETQALVAGSIGNIGSSEGELVPLSLDGAAVMAGQGANLECKTFIGWMVVATLERYPAGDIYDGSSSGGGSGESTISNLAIGPSKVVNIYIGTSEVLKIYLGETLVYRKGDDSSNGGDIPSDDVNGKA